VRDLFSAAGINTNDEAVAAIADSRGRFIRKPVQLHELIKRMKTELEIKRICKYCGWRLDEPDLEILAFFHSGCWKVYRKPGGVVTTTGGAPTKTLRESMLALTDILYDKAYLTSFHLLPPDCIILT
jgi:hypothetical protein